MIETSVIKELNLFRFWLSWDISTENGGLKTDFKWQNQSPRGLLKKGVPKNFAKFTGQHLFWILFFNKISVCNFIKIETPKHVFSCEFWESFKKIFFIELLRWLFRKWISQSMEYLLIWSLMLLLFYHFYWKPNTWTSQLGLMKYLISLKLIHHLVPLNKHSPALHDLPHYC